MSEPNLRLVPPGAQRDAYLPLLSLADDSAKQVRSYYQEGTLYALDDAAGRPVGITLALPGPDGVVELKAVAIDASLQGQGVGKRLLLAVLDQLRKSSVTRVIVGTGNSGIGQLVYYQKVGFRLWKIERDFFSAERGYPDGIEENGILLRDMVWMDQDLSSSEPRKGARTIEHA